MAEIQGLPFAFSDHEEVHAAMRGELGDHIRAEMAAKGIHGFRDGVLENGFRHIVSIDRPVTRAEDLIGYRMRIPAGRIFEDFFARSAPCPSSSTSASFTPRSPSAGSTARRTRSWSPR